MGNQSIYKAESGEFREQRRDILKYYLGKFQMEIASYGIENQSSTDDTIAVRVMGYDYASYRKQLDNKKSILSPVITIVLNFSEKPWEKKSLCACMDIPEFLMPYVQDYKVHVFDIAFLEDEVIDRFTSDFKMIARFFRNKRLGITKLDDEQEIVHVEAFLDFLSIFSNDERYQESKKYLGEIKKKGGKYTMCKMLDIWIEQGIEKGIEQGIEQGIEKGIEKGIEQGIEKGIEKGIEQGIEKGIETLVVNALRKGRSISEVADFNDLAVEAVERIAQKNGFAVPV